MVLLAACPGAASNDICSGVVCAPGRLCKQGLCVGGPGVDASDADSGSGDGAPPQGDGPLTQPDQAAAKCGDKSCNNQETCQSCPEDCGACACLPPQDESTATGCGACERKRRECQPDFTWGAWEACKTTCEAGFDCSAGRCTSLYDAAGGVVGPYCGYITGAGTYTHVFCKAGDFCLDATNRKCRGYQLHLPGDVYHAYVHPSSSTRGSTCGYEERFLDTTYEVFCDLNIPCTNYTLRECTW